MKGLKKAVIKSLSVMLAVVLILTAAPLSGFVGIELPEWLDFSIDVKAENAPIQIGESITLGKYNGTPIEWVCVDIDDNGLLMLAKEVICQKEYDAAGDNSKYHSDGWGYIRKQYGSNCWEDSNIRQWLNTSGTVDYSHCPPSYKDEMGFMSNFTTEELLCVKKVAHKVTMVKYDSTRNGYCDGGSTDAFSYGESFNIDNCYHKLLEDYFMLLDASQVNSLIKSNSPYLNCSDSYFTAAISGNNYACFELVNPIGGGTNWACKSNGIRPAFYLDTENYYIDDSICHVTWSFDESTGTLKVSGTGAMHNYSYDNRPWGCYEDDIKEIVIENGVTSISEYAFEGCNSLTSVTIPDSVTTIGDRAFYWCDSLTSVTIGDSVTTIGSYAFYYCSSLTSVTIPDSVTTIDDDAFGNCDSLTDVYYSGNEEQWNNITIGSRNEDLINATIHYNHVVKSIAVLSTNKSFTVKTGDKMGLSFGIMTNGMLEEDWKKMSIVVSDPTIVSLGNYKETDYGYAIDITGLKEGSTNLTITDTETGLSASIVVNVFDEYTETYSYSIENIATFHPNNSWEDHLNTCIYDMNGLYVDNYSATKSGDKYIVTFDAYNQRYHHGAVDIYDADGNWIGSEQIEKYSDISSLYDTGEQIYYMIFGGSWVTYQHAMQSKKTSIEIEVPDGGYFTISNNFAASHGTFFYNFSEILFDASMTWLEATVDYAVGDIDIDAGDLAKLLIDNVLENPNARDAWVEIFKTTIKDLLVNFEKDILSGSIDKAYSNLSTEVESVLYSALKIDWKNLLKTASGIGESAFEKFAGPAGVALNGCFFISGSLNKMLQANNLAVSIDEAYATIYSSIAEGYINPHGVIVNTNGNMDTEAVLQVFRVSNDDCVDVILNSDNPLEQHELYNICFVKNDELVKPNGKVKVYVPIPEGMDSNTCVIYRQETDGSWTILEATIENNYLVFETDHFSLYALVGNRAELTIKSLPNKLIYTRNDVIDTTGLVLELNGELISDGYYCTPSVMFDYGTQTITVQYGKTTTQFEVTVQEPEYNYTFNIQEPSRTEIRNKDGIILYANIEGNAPEGSYIRWESSNGNFNEDADGNKLEIIAKNKGWTTFTAVLCDADGNELARDSIEMYSKSGFFDKIGGFFRSLFGSTKIYEN